MEHNNNEFHQTIRIDRPVISQKDIYTSYKDIDLHSNKDAIVESGLFGLRNCKCTFTPVKWIFSCIPFLHWFTHYKWKSDITNDIIAGFTVAVMHIPQGMAYALLANVPPIVGIYMAFFPVIVYSFLGTSRHVSMGTFAVICLMTGKVVEDKMSQYEELKRYESLLDAEDDHLNVGKKAKYNAVEVATAISFAVGIWQGVMGLFRLGTVSLLLSSELVSGFTTGAAVHVLTSQVKNFFGVNTKRRVGFFKIPLTYYDIAKNLQHSNVAAIIISVVTITCLTLYNELLKPYVSKKLPFPIPVELITIVIGTLVSYIWDMANTYNIAIVDTIPTGFPPPALPPMDVVPDVLFDGLIISFVAYAISISMAKIFAKKHDYRVDANQELIALGTSNIVGSFFSCAPVSASLARSLVQDFVGGRTQLAGLFSCGILVFVLLWLGPYFETLPNCVLSSIIIVALKGMFLQAIELPKIWRECSIQAMIWVATFLSTVILDIEYGLGVGMLMSMLTLIWRSNKPDITILGVYENSDLYIDLSAAKNVAEIPGVKIIKYAGSLNFATIERFVEKVNKIVHLNTNRLEKSLSVSPGGSRSSKSNIISSVSTVDGSLNEIQESNLNFRFKWIILDLSSAGSVGPGAVRALISLHRAYKAEGTQIVYSGCSLRVLDQMYKCHLMHELGNNGFFPTVHDAVVYCSSLKV